MAMLNWDGLHGDPPAVRREWLSDWRSDPEAVIQCGFDLGRVFPHEVESTVLVGHRSLALADPLLHRAPSLRRIFLVLPEQELEQENDPAPRESLDRLCGQGIEIAVVSHPISEEGYNRALYLELVEFLQRGAGLERVFALPAWAIGESLDAWHEEQQAVIDDLLWGYSTRFLARPVESRGVAMRLLQWTDTLMAQRQHFHALQFCYRLRTLLGPERLASWAVECLAQLRCFRLLLEWIPSMKAGSQQRAELEAATRSSLESHEAEAESLFQKNLETLKAHRPAVHRAIVETPARDSSYTAWLSDVPWMVQFGSFPYLQATDYAIHFHLEGDRLVASNLPIVPATHFRWIEAATHALLVGTVAPYSTLLNFLINVPRLCPYYFHLEILQTVYVVEQDPERLRELMRTLPLEPILSQARVLLFVGERAAEDLADYLLARPMRLLPRLQLHVDAALRARLVTVQKQRVIHAEALQEELLSGWAADRNRELLEVLSGRGQRPLRVWLKVTDFDQANPVYQRALQRAFEGIGAEVCLHHEQDGCDRMSPEAELASLVAFRPDLVLLNDELRTHLPYAIPSEIPVLCWFQDDIARLRDPECIRELGDYDFTYATCIGFVQVCQELGYPRVKQLPVGVDPDLHRPDPSLGPPRDEVVLVTQMAPPREIRGFPGLVDWSARALRERGVTFQNYERLSALAREGIATLRLAFEEPALPRVVEELILLERQVHYQEVVRWLIAGKVPVALYGRGWEHWPEFAALARGEVPFGAPARQAYQSGKVLLHVNINVNLHQRIFEGIAAGALLAVRSLASDRQPGGLGDYLEIGREVLVFSSQEELVVLAERAFRDEVWRQQMIQAGRRRVLADHTNEHRLKAMMEDVRSTLANRMNS